MFLRSSKSLSEKHFRKQRANGLEPSTFSLEGCKPAILSDEKTDTYDSTAGRLADSLAELAQNDPDLDLVNAAWAELPEALRAGIVAMVKASAKPGT